jgi:hypothetical protein
VREPQEATVKADSALLEPDTFEVRASDASEAWNDVIKVAKRVEYPENETRVPKLIIQVI